MAKTKSVDGSGADLGSWLGVVGSGVGWNLVFTTQVQLGAWRVSGLFVSFPSAQLSRN